MIIKNYVDVTAPPTKEVTIQLLPVHKNVALDPTVGILTFVFDPPEWSRKLAGVILKEVGAVATNTTVIV